MPRITLTRSASSHANSGWYDLDTSNTIKFQYNANSTIGGAGIEITQIQIHGRVRNSSSASKSLQIGFKPALNSARGTWSTYNGSNVVGSPFVAISGSNSGSYIYRAFSLTYSGTANSGTFSLLAGHIKERFSSGQPIYLGIINTRASSTISVDLLANYWTIDIDYELLGNIPSTNVSSAALGSSVTTTLNKVISGSTTTIRYKIGSDTISTANVGTAATHSFTIPTSAGQYFPNEASATMTVEAETFVDSVSYGTVSTSVTLTLPSDAAPTATCSASRTWVSGVSSAAQIAAYVQLRSGVNFALSGTPKYGAAISSFRLTFDGKTHTRTGNGSIAHSPISGSGTLSYTYTVFDSRGMSRSYTGSITVLPWSVPKIAKFAVERVNAFSQPAIDGTYAQITLQVSGSPLSVSSSQKNSLGYYVQYKVAGASAWTNADTVNSSSMTISTSFLVKKSGANVGSFDDLTGYDFRLVLWDIYTTVNAVAYIPTKERFWHVDKNTGSMGFGGEARLGESTPHYDFYGPVHFHAGATGQMVYTGAEKDTGLRWIDGRPIYCKTFRGAHLVNGDGNGTVLGYIDDLCEVVRFDGYVRRADSDTVMSLNYPYFNNSQQMIATNIRNDGAVRLIKGSAWTCKTYVVSVLYTKATDAPTYYYLPFLTTGNEQGCIITASSEYSGNYPAEYAFNGRAGDHWACTDADTQRWIQAQMPYALRNIIVTLTNPKDSGGTLQTNAVNIPTVGTFLGSNDGSSWTQIGSFSGRTTAEGEATTHALANSSGYKYLRVRFTAPGPATNTWGGFSDIRIEGEVVS